MDRTQKAEVVSALNVSLGEVGVVVVTRNLGLTVAQSTDLRQKMRDAGAAYKVTHDYALGGSGSWLALRTLPGAIVSRPPRQSMSSRESRATSPLQRECRRSPLPPGSMASM